MNSGNCLPRKSPYEQVLEQLGGHQKGKAGAQACVVCARQKRGVGPSEADIF